MPRPSYEARDICYEDNLQYIDATLASRYLRLVRSLISAIAAICKTGFSSLFKVVTVQ